MTKSKLSVLMIGLALSAAAPSMPAWAQDRDRDNQRNDREDQEDRQRFGARIERDEVPEAAMRAFKQYVPEGSKRRVFHRNKINDVPVFIERFTHPDGRRLALTVRKDGSLVEPNEVAVITGRALPAAPGQAAPPVAVPVPGQPLPPVGQPAVLTQQQAREQMAALEQQQAQVRAQATQIDAQIAQDQRRLPPLENLVRQGDQGAATERQRTQERIQQLTAQRDQLTLQSADINARQRALATQAGLPAPLPTDNAREAAVREPAIRDRDPLRDPIRDRDPVRDPDRRVPAGDDRRALRAVQRDDVPNAVVMAVSRQADGKGGHDWQWFRANTDDYIVRYTTQDNRQWETLIDNSGKVLEPARSIGGAAAADDRNDRNALRRVDRNDVPNAVVMAVSRQADGKGGGDWEWFRVGNSDEYVVRYTTGDDRNRQLETRIDKAGRVIEPARALRR